MLRKHPMAQRWNQLIDFMLFHHAVVAARQGPCQRHSWGSYTLEKGDVPWPLEQLIITVFLKLQLGDARAFYWNHFESRSSCFCNRKCSEQPLSLHPIPSWNRGMGPGIGGRARWTTLRALARPEFFHSKLLSFAQSILPFSCHWKWQTFRNFWWYRKKRFEVGWIAGFFSA